MVDFTIMWGWAKENDELKLIICRSCFVTYFEAMATPGILSRVFLFHFEKISGVLGRFGKYRLKFKIWPAWSLCLKKKMFLKSKQICILYTEKSQKEKKMKRKKMNKGTYTINYKFIWNINKITNYCCLVVS